MHIIYVCKISITVLANNMSVSGFDWKLLSISICQLSLVIIIPIALILLAKSTLWRQWFPDDFLHLSINMLSALSHALLSYHGKSFIWHISFVLTLISGLLSQKFHISIESVINSVYNNKCFTFYAFRYSTCLNSSNFNSFSSLFPIYNFQWSFF